MDKFSDLYWQLDATTKTNEKVAALKRYFEVTEPADAIWAIYFLSGRRIKRLVGTRLIRDWAIQRANISSWLFEECYERVGDLAETISLVLPDVTASDPISLRDLVEQQLLPLRNMSVEQQRHRVIYWWNQFGRKQNFVFGKLITGGFRVGVSNRLLIRALAEHTSVDVATIAHRLTGQWNPDVEFYQSLVDRDEGETPISKPYPFFLANPIKDTPDLTMGRPQDWIAEWKWDGIRAQLIRRESQTFIWSRGGDLVTDQFPEVETISTQLPDGTVLDGELVGWCDSENRPLQFSQLQRRLGRKKLGKRLLSEVPVKMLAFDLLERNNMDIRHLPLVERQSQLAELVGELAPDRPVKAKGLFDDQESEATCPAIRLSPAVTLKQLTTWKQFAKHRDQARQIRAEGLMLKRRDSTYQVGRPVGDWWKWKVDPYTIDAVLVYAQRGHGRRASLYTDYTFAVWKDGELLPLAKAYSGLTDAEIRQVDAFIRKNINEKFGPVRSVTPALVFELAFENIQRSTRHKSGIAVRFPRISRWRHDKKPEDADRLETILEMITDE